MSEEYLSIADRWMLRFEQEHPEIAQEVKARYPTQPNPWRPEEQMNKQTPSVQSKTRGNTSLWLTSEMDENTRNRPIDPVVLKAIQARKSKKLTQATFARCLGVSPRTVSEWEQGRRQPCAAARTLLHWVSVRPELLKQAVESYRQERAGN
ncbi:helix-turn-helix domain-containing protein [Neptuniibacter sp. QD29_5]|uniref:helix-turn-helix domain-containing protein n=1 Tax=Neptuniibacter sp. QD29_5 TaxID=3398207 RepID=UPI0039F604DC